MRQGTRTGGFTLIELLIVIAIIGILAAVLIPNLLAARQRAFDTAAQACARGIATAAEIKMIDSNSYGGLDETFVQENGGNACTEEIIVTGLPVTDPDATTYTITTKHKKGARTFQVTPTGITDVTQ